MLSDLFLGNSAENWLIAFVCIFISLLISNIVYRIFRFVIRRVTGKTQTNVDDLILTRLRVVVMVGIVFLGFRIGYSFLVFDNSVHTVIQRGFILVSVFIVTWFFARIVGALIEEFIKNQSIGEGNESIRFSPVLRRMVIIIIWTIGTITGLNNAGMDVGALLAGLGIGGLAIALASQDTVKNMIGGLIILFDKPFKLGESIKIDGIEGVVEDIGLRSTRLRGPEGMLITIPNNMFSDKTIINVARMKNKKIDILLHLSQANKAELIQKICKEIQTMIKDEKSVIPNSAEVVLSTLGPKSIDVNVSFRIMEGEATTDIKHRFMMKILFYLNNNQVILMNADSD